MLSHHKEEHIIDVAEASRLGCSMTIPVLLIYVFPYFIIWKDSLSSAFFVDGYLDILHPMLYPVIGVAILILGILLHELLHGLPWSFFAKNGWSSIRFGILRPHFVPYCHCTEPLRIIHYVIGALTPLVTLGFAPVIYAWFTGNWLCLLFGTFFTLSAIGDIMIVYTMRKLKPDTWVLDHPSEPGFFIYRY
ncbi:DUF3267 domain-containing protein [Sphingobacterium sp. lm-10]|uniref:DUF3267 domain-containing protein n=1 Tax=Sphingobacterium sp. lm-10 TaxID=2944904 RepID=UPI002021995F|nr:DUF3267 domain-containing protein [Sphingobacterium sp. lm-10]MCL7986399.1 DUF3267 domain-containing protein [Sphingobacterium sp. lm-10]